MTDLNKKWMSTGLIGCTFAALFARDPARVGWKTIEDARELDFKLPNDDTLILSLQFPGWSQQRVLSWAIMNGFYVDFIGQEQNVEYYGMRLKVGNDISWVQYFGPDSHVKTRQSPIPELMFLIKLPKKYYFKVGFNGILHLAHTSIQYLTGRKADKAWDTSFNKTEKLLGQKPDISQAAKTTFRIVTYTGQVSENASPETLNALDAMVNKAYQTV